MENEKENVGDLRAQNGTGEGNVPETDKSTSAVNSSGKKTAILPEPIVGIVPEGGVVFRGNLWANANQTHGPTMHNLYEMPPCNIDAEKSVIGGILIDTDAGERTDEVLDLLDPADFYGEPYRAMFRVLRSLRAEGQPTNDAVVFRSAIAAQKLEQECGGDALLLAVLDIVPSAANLLHYARLVSEKATLRRTREAGGAIVALTHDTERSAEEIADEAERLLLAATDGHGTNEAISVTAGEANDELLTALVARAKGETKNVKSGLLSLDRIIPGFVSGALHILAARPATGKCLGKGTPVMMFDGSIKPVESVLAGELLMGPDSKPRKVLSTAKGFGPLYKVTPIKGDAYVVNDAHILSLRMNKRAWSRDKGEIVNVNVQDYLAAPVRFRHSAKGWRTSINFPARPVSLDPYFLGIWLGDGSTCGASVTTADYEVEDFCRSYAHDKGLSLRGEKRFPDSKCSTFYLTTGVNSGRKIRNPVIDALDYYDLRHNKHIPDDFKFNDRATRLQVLSGIIDSDGYLTSGCYELVVKDEELADDCVWIARSLGFAAYKSPCVKGIKSLGFTGNYFRIFISGDLTELPVRVARRKAPARKMNKNVTNVGIKVAPCGEGEWFGFEIDGDHLFLLGDFTVTHNTAAALTIGDNIAERGGRVAFFTMEMTNIDVAERRLAKYAQINSRKFKEPHFTSEEKDAITRATEKIRKLPFMQDDEAALTVRSMRSRLRRMRQKMGGLDFVLIDYIQLATGESLRAQKDKRLEVLEVVKGLKVLAKEFNVPILALAQLNRDCEKREDKRPQLSDLAESGEIENIAWTVSFLYRASKYAPPDTAPLPPDAVDDVEWIVAKHRDGLERAVKLGLRLPYTQFVDLDETGRPILG